ncbi:MAG: hypothetical protein QNK33_03260 [Bacteroidales bacterium]|nr:hypothetical protein [Bacteroidales bacterium]
MKKLYQNSYGKGLLCTILIMLLAFAIACTKEDLVPDNDNNKQYKMKSKTLAIKKGTTTLEGFTRFDVYAKKEHKVITDGHINNFLACTAELIFTGKHNFVLNTQESFILPDGSQMMIREISFNGMITPSGKLKFSWPETWFEMGEEITDVLGHMNLHMGYIFHGPGVNKNTLNYKGYFDGEKFFAEMHLIGFQEKPGTIPFYFELVDGPIAINFSIELEVSD